MVCNGYKPTFGSALARKFEHVLDLIRVYGLGGFMLHAMCLLECLGFCMFMDDF